MTYVANPTDGTRPLDGDDASGGAAELRALKAYLQTLIASGPTPTGYAWAGFRNRVINGNCAISQRGSVAVVPSGSFQYGGPDRFRANIGSTTAGALTQDQDSITYSGLNSKAVRQTVTTIATDFSTNKVWNGICQTIESFNCYDLQNAPFVVSFIFQAKVPGQYSAAILTNNGTIKSYVTSFNIVAADTPQSIQIAIPAGSGLTIPQDNSAGLSINIGALNTGTYQAATAGWNTGGFVSVAGNVNWAATVGNYIKLSNLQLEPGLVATPFEFRPFAVELPMCYRYFQYSRVVLHGTWTSAVIARLYLEYLASMRSTPASTLLATNFQIEETGKIFHVATGGSISTGNLGPETGFVDLTASSWTNGAAVVGYPAQFTATGTNLLSLSAEL